MRTVIVATDGSACRTPGRCRGGSRPERILTVAGSASSDEVRAICRSDPGRGMQADRGHRTRGCQGAGRVGWPSETIIEVARREHADAIMAAGAAADSSQDCSWEA